MAPVFGVIIFIAFAAAHQPNKIAQRVKYYLNEPHVPPSKGYVPFLVMCIVIFCR